MGLMDSIKKTFGSKDPTTVRQQQHAKDIKKSMKTEDRKVDLAHRKNECRIMLADSEAFFKQAMNREIKNARKAVELDIDYTLNKNHFSDAMRGMECIERARWYLDSMSSEEGLQGALRLLNKALKSMDRLDGGSRVVNERQLRKRVANLYETDDLTEEDAILDPNQEYKYKFENGLFENMMAGMSYEAAKKASNQDLSIGGTPVGSPSAYSAIFAEKPAQLDPEEAARRKQMMDSRKDET